MHQLLIAAVTTAGLFAALSASAANTALKDVMKRMGAELAGGNDVKGLAPIFAETKSIAPSDPACSSWATIADKGKAAAEKGDRDGAKATCKECHSTYRDAYKTKYGSKAP
jgi:hypothetical protein